MSWATNSFLSSSCSKMFVWFIWGVFFFFLHYHRWFECNSVWGCGTWYVTSEMTTTYATSTWHPVRYASKLNSEISGHVAGESHDMMYALAASISSSGNRFPLNLPFAPHRSCMGNRGEYDDERRCAESAMATTYDVICCIIGARTCAHESEMPYSERPAAHAHHVTVRYWEFCNTSPSDFGVRWIPQQYLNLSVALVMSGNFRLRWHNRCSNFRLCQRNRNLSNGYVSATETWVSVVKKY
jgi:hypothetical protein